jgi:hypothetical protein
MATSDADFIFQWGLHFDFYRAVLILFQIKKEGNSHELPNPIFVNLKSNTIMKKLRYKDRGKCKRFPNLFS